MSVVSVNSLAAYDQLKKQAGKRAVIIDFFATWCGPCRRIAPHVENLAKMYSQTAVFGKVDVDQAQDVKQALSIRSMPTFHIYLQGELKEEIIGANPIKLEVAVRKYAPDTVAFEGRGQTLGRGPSPDGNTAAGSGPKIVWETPSGNPEERIVSQLLLMGFDEARARLAVRRTSAESTGAAVEFLRVYDDLPEDQRGGDEQEQSPRRRAARDSARTNSLFIGLPDGDNMELQVSGNDTLGYVWEELTRHRPQVSGREFQLQQQYPRKTYSKTDAAMSLKTAQLDKRGKLNVVLT